MKLSKYTDVVTLVANVGVFIGVIFLIVQIQQANQIATRDSRDHIVDSHIQSIGHYMENPDHAALLVKLRIPSPELTDLEKVQASLMASNQYFVWSKINVGATAGLLPEENEQGLISIARDFMKTFPGLVPFLGDILLSVNPTKENRDTTGIYAAMWEEFEAHSK